MKKIIVAICALVALVSVSPGEDLPALAVRWQVGKVYTFETVIKNVAVTRWIDTAGAPRPAEMKSDMTQTIRLKVIGERADGGWDAAWRMQWAKSWQETNGKEMAFETGMSSANDKSPPVRIWNQYALKTFKITLKADGTMDKVDGMDEFRKEMIDQFGPQAGRFIDEWLGTQNMKVFFEYLLPIALPSKPVPAGSSWDWKGTRMVGGATVEDDLKNSFTEWSDVGGTRCARIDFSGKVEANMEDMEEMPGMQTSMKSGKVSGHTLFDPALGMPREIENKQSVTIERRFPSPAGVQKSEQENEVDVVLKLMSVE